MAYCLPVEFADDFKKALAEGLIKPEQLAGMSSDERAAFFEKIVGKDNAHEVNAAFESKLLLRDWKRGLVTWAKQITGLSEPAKRDLLARIENMDERVLNPQSERAFLKDLVAQKLGAGVSLPEWKLVGEQSQKIQAARAKYDVQAGRAGIDEAIKNGKPVDPMAGWKSAEDKRDYGYAVADMQELLATLQHSNKAWTWDEIKANPKLAVWTGIKKAAALPFTLSKAILSSLDNSFWGHQGFMVLMRNPKIWANGFLKSWGDIARTVAGKDVLREIKADVYSNPLAMDGTYSRSGIDIGINYEEAFPTTIQEKLPGIGRFFKAADVAYSGGAIRMRAALMDWLAPKAEQYGLSMRKTADAKAVGKLVNSMTGRGDVGLAGKGAGAVNAAFFSPRWLKAQIDTLTGFRLAKFESPEAAKFVRAQAARNLLGLALTYAAVTSIAKSLDPNSTSVDPHSSLFGKIRVGDTTIDYTAGMAALATLASRLVPTEHNGKWSFWYENADGKWTDLRAGKYGQQTALDVFNGFFEGKLSPAAGVLRDIWENDTYAGTKPTAGGEALGLVEPLPIQTATDLLNNPNSAPFLIGMIADGLGFNTSTKAPK
jgi:hypothetical protein